ncbi:hypothetical protein [Propionivibrio soli]|uniref:hypothetical protein n=1 Tax=Propionivibrio soli TaxID=2976531 RepID=UPI0021E72F36|nr:hypothetical protein [Propionivibrio soli]
MRIEKRKLADLPSCYSCNTIEVDGKTRILLASEADKPCLAWTSPDYTESHTVWEGPGGTMSIVPVPGTNGEFIAVQKFYRMFDWEEAKVVHVRPLPSGKYEVTDILQLPYVHRIDLLTVGDRHYFIACTLATKKATKDDWSTSGKILVGEYNGAKPLSVTVLKEGITKNHGYSRLVRDGVAHGLVTGEEGAFEVTPPQTPGGQWSVHQFMDWPISDISAIDIDGDGELEFATIEAFHGEYFRVYKKINGEFRKIYEHPEVTEFYHVVVGATLAGKPVFVGGCRRGKQQLFYVRPKTTSPLQLEAVLIEEGVGPSNAMVVHEKGRDLLVVANREIDQAALYVVTP